MRFAMRPRRIVRVSQLPRAAPSHIAGNAIDEQHLGELPEDFMSERLSRNPILSPRVTQYAQGSAPTFAPGSSTMGLPRYRSSITPFIAGVTSQKAVPANPQRAFLLIQNNNGGGNKIFVNFGSDANALNSIVIIDGGNAVFEGGDVGGSFVPQEDVYILGQAAGLACIVMEGLVTVGA
jgi:hypothetical protein